MILECIILQLLLLSCTVTAYSAYKSPAIDRRAIAGLWRLTPRIVPTFPMKEFTLYPKTVLNVQPLQTPPDVLLMLKEDGSFQQYQQTDDDNVDVDASWTEFQRNKKQRESLQALVKGIWDYRDGRLILAADRDARSKEPSDKKEEDTMLEGKVVATYEESLQDNPALPVVPVEQQQLNVLDDAMDANAVKSSNLTAFKVASKTDTATTQTASSDTSRDTHLSVPKGSVKVGKFFYPKKHPSFFEQVMFKPDKRGSFSLRQVLGSLNTQAAEEQEIEKFARHDFHNKTFLLTSSPIGHKLPKGNVRWSIKYNKFVHDPPSKAAKEQADAEKAQTVPIRVMQVQFHANDTFSTVAGLGESILRGKYDILGQDKDQLWMQVVIFGFGRSVSGSVFSEGRMLTHDDAKMYWGKIDYQKTNDGISAIESAAQDPMQPTLESAEDTPLRLEVNGSVMFGSGLEPMPVARFIMREVTETDSLDYDEDDDEDEEEEGVDWSNVFQ